MYDEIDGERFRKELEAFIAKNCPNNPILISYSLVIGGGGEKPLKFANACLSNVRSMPETYGLMLALVSQSLTQTANRINRSLGVKEETDEKKKETPE
ncbi:MAG: hypothetical protein QXP42_00675 [Candidatus Micrarchaeia archaeon]